MDVPQVVLEAFVVVGRFGLVDFVGNGVHGVESVQTHATLEARAGGLSE